MVIICKWFLCEA